MKKPQLLLIALAIFSTSLTTAKTASFTWQDELCEFKGQYNNQKYSEQQLKDSPFHIFDKNEPEKEEGNLLLI